MSHEKLINRFKKIKKLLTNHILFTLIFLKRKKPILIQFPFSNDNKYKNKLHNER